MQEETQACIFDAAGQKTSTRIEQAEAVRLLVVCKHKSSLTGAGTLPCRLFEALCNAFAMLTCMPQGAPNQAVSTGQHTASSIHHRRPAV